MSGQNIFDVSYTCPLANAWGWNWNREIKMRTSQRWSQECDVELAIEVMLKRVLTRINTITRMAYKDDPTIMAWELINEPRCQVDLSGRTVNGWVQEMATYTKSIDNKHMLEIGMEIFYGDSIPDRKQVNPGYQVGTDFISSNLIEEIDFSTIHAYPDIWLKGQNEDAQVNFVNRWMSSHWSDSKTVIQKPLVFSEFGKSSKDPGYSLSERNSFLNDVYNNIYNDARIGGAFGGGFFWQLLAEGMNEYDDGYGIVLSQNPTTAAIISMQSHKMTALDHLFVTPQSHLHHSSARKHAISARQHRHAHGKHGGARRPRHCGRAWHPRHRSRKIHP